MAHISSRYVARSSAALLRQMRRFAAQVQYMFMFGRFLTKETFLFTSRRAAATHSAPRFVFAAPRACLRYGAYSQRDVCYACLQELQAFFAFAPQFPDVATPSRRTGE
jgi:hypothetical protein